MEKLIGISELGAEVCEALMGVDKIRGCWIDKNGETSSTAWLDNTQSGRRSVLDSLACVDIESRSLNVCTDSWIETRKTQTEKGVVRPERKHLRVIVDNTKR
jgi:hypothetical protein